ncbi:hypothetical protein [Jidongwangia harbinensis]|uniref:hypothetical protein n=1 Tax=Jidongwangia harbinensis TaxID=2878561 RepID=UPI001CDA4E25|nr:hypothetical protein [Jidongwangia harbinensis]MCA2219025.1 hypothetical protein [Jidongwangia harbinensis]
MKAHHPIPAIVASGLVVSAVLLAAWRGLPQGAVFGAVVGLLTSAYLVRHVVRKRLVYDRLRDGSDGSTSRSIASAGSAGRQTRTADVREASGAA